jgi:hypothetical protein
MYLVPCSTFTAIHNSIGRELVTRPPNFLCRRLPGDVSFAPYHYCTAGYLTVNWCFPCHFRREWFQSADNGQSFLGSAILPCQSFRFLAAALRRQFSVPTLLLLRFFDRITLTYSAGTYAFLAPPVFCPLRSAFLLLDAPKFLGRPSLLLRFQVRLRRQSICCWFSSGLGAPPSHGRPTSRSGCRI